jgi:hypothetical protein
VGQKGRLKPQGHLHCDRYFYPDNIDFILSGYKWQCMSAPHTVIAFAGPERIATGDIAHVTAHVRRAMKRAPQRAPILVFDAASGDQIDLDLRDDEHSSRHRPVEHDPPKGEERRGPGRPKLGVVAREVTLLPRHWNWLVSQPGGVSVALRKLVEHAMRANVGKDRMRTAQNAAYRFMSVMAGNRAGFEEASRALFAGDAEKFRRLANAWPRDIRDLTLKLASDAFPDL